MPAGACPSAPRNLGMVGATDEGLRSPRRQDWRPMKLEAVELRRVGIPLVAPFRTSFGTETHKDALLVRAIGAGAEGWGECVAMTDPLYSSEYADGAEHVLRHHLLPRLFSLGDVAAAGVADALA